MAEWSMCRPSEAGGEGVGRGVACLPRPKIFVNVPFSSMSSLNAAFLKEVTENVHENQYYTGLC